MTAPNISFPQADAIIEQLTTRIHELIGTEYRDAAINAASRAEGHAIRAETAADNAAVGIRDDTITKQHLAPELRSEVDGKADRTEVPTTAADVGARPDTWAPTAGEVGARPDTWMPTASDVGAREASWTPTAQEVGARPDTWRPASADISDATDTGGEGSGGKVVKWNASGEILRPGGDTPGHWESLVNRRYVDSRIQLVTAWPASPTPGVLYLMAED